MASKNRGQMSEKHLNKHSTNSYGRWIFSDEFQTSEPVFASEEYRQQFVTSKRLSCGNPRFPGSSTGIRRLPTDEDRNEGNCSLAASLTAHKCLQPRRWAWPSSVVPSRGIPKFLAISAACDGEFQSDGNLLNWPPSAFSHPPAPCSDDLLPPSLHDVFSKRADS